MKDKIMEIKVVSLDEYLNQFRDWPDAVITVMDDLHFEKVPVEDHHLYIKARDIYDEKDHDLRFNNSHLEKILEFVKNENPERLLIHCHQGISRSAAVAFILFYIETRDYETALNKLLEIRRFAWPNNLIVEVADNYLDLNGEMLSFIEKWKDDQGGKLQW